MHVKTRMGLENFEVGKYRNRYVPLRSCLGKGRCRPVNQIPRANICLNVDAGCNWRGAPPSVSTPFLPGSEKKKGKFNKKVSSNWLKITEQVAYGQTLIATRGFCVCQNPYGQTMLIKLSQILGQ